MNMKNYLVIALVLAVTLIHAQLPGEAPWNPERPDAFAPVSVFGDHMHEKGTWMFSYRYSHENMADLKRGTEDIDINTALSQALASPTGMLTKRHMLEIMFAPTDRITLMAMASYVAMEMDLTSGMVLQNPGVFSTESSGPGDTRFAIMYRIHSGSRTHLHAQLGVSLPTGSIDNTDQTPTSVTNEMVLPYPMQTGSGTYDIEPALTWFDQWKNLSSGMQIRGIYRLGENDGNYRLGHRVSIQKWLAGKISPWLSISGRLEWGAHEKIQGEDARLDPMEVINADTANSGKTYANAGFGINLYAFKGLFKDLRLGAEAILPVYQNLYGIQLKEETTLVFGLQYSL